MNGYKLFLEKLRSLSEEEQSRVINVIFDKEIVLFGINELDNNIYFKIYDGEIYYQYCFIFEQNDNYVEIKIRDRIVVVNIFVFSDRIEFYLSENMYRLVKMFRDGENMFNSFL